MKLDELQGFLVNMQYFVSIASNTDFLIILSLEN